MRIALICFMMSMLFAALSAEDGSILKTGSYNLRCLVDKAPNDWKNRGPRMIALLKKEQFDIFGAQEAVTGHIETLSQNGYHYVGRGRNATNSGEFSCIFFNPERIECLENTTFWLSLTPEVPGSRSWESACPRICTYGIFLDRKSGRKFVFANTHLDHKSTEAKEKGMQLILERLSPFVSQYPVILTGDFNSAPSSIPVSSVEKLLRDARSISKSSPTGPLSTFHGYIVDPEKRRIKNPIDYIFVSPNIPVLSFRVIDDFNDGLSSSDHFPISADVKIP